MVEVSGAGTCDGRWRQVGCSQSCAGHMFPRQGDNLGHCIIVRLALTPLIVGQLNWAADKSENSEKHMYP
ncbi:hypothetical protein J6590_017114, partial [Homalodisca vitripennis]